MASRKRPTRRGVLLATLALLGAVSSARAQGGPPLLTDDPFTPPPYHWEINTAWAGEHAADGTTSELPTLDLNYGWGPRVQLNIETPYRWVSSAEASRRGWGNVMLGVKYRFADHLAGWAVSTFPHLQIPTSGKHARRVDGDSTWAFLLPLEAAHSQGRLELNAELGYWFGDADLREVVAGGVIGWVASDRLELLSECNIHGIRPFHPAEVVCGVGARRDITEHVRLMGAFEPVVGGSDPGRPKYHAYLGLQTHIRGGGFWQAAGRALGRR